jgi:hypothetical protein
MTWFWIIVIALVALVLFFAWRADRRSRPFRARVKPPENDPAVGEAKAQHYRRGLDGMGPGRGP